MKTKLLNHSTSRHLLVIVCLCLVLGFGIVITGQFVQAQPLPEVYGDYQIQVIEPPPYTHAIYAALATQNGMLVMQYDTPISGTAFNQGHTALFENGEWKIIDVPDSVWTGLGTPSESGRIPLAYGDDNGGIHNAIYNQGNYLQLPDYSGAAGPAPYPFLVQMMNDHFIMTGIAFDPESSCIDMFGQPCMRGVFLNTSLSLFQTFQFPDGVSTYPMGINNRNQTVGGYQALDGTYHAFLSDQGKTFVNIDPPDSAFGPAPAWSINDKMEICGSYFNNSGVQQGFLLMNGTFSVFNIPNSGWTSLYFITNNGQLTGSYVDKDGAPHAFIAIPKPARR